MVIMDMDIIVEMTAGAVVIVVEIAGLAAAVAVETAGLVAAVEIAGPVVAADADESNDESAQKLFEISIRK
jgi:hypothetical protein